MMTDDPNTLPAPASPAGEVTAFDPMKAALPAVDRQPWNTEGSASINVATDSAIDSVPIGVDMPSGSEIETSRPDEASALDGGLGNTDEQPGPESDAATTEGTKPTPGVTGLTDYGRTVDKRRYPKPANPRNNDPDNVWHAPIRATTEQTTATTTQQPMTTMPETTTSTTETTTTTPIPTETTTTTPIPTETTTTTPHVSTGGF